jgi:hypothetical protein
MVCASFINSLISKDPKTKAQAALATQGFKLCILSFEGYLMVEPPGIEPRIAV